MAISRPAGRYHARLGPPFSEKRFRKCRERLTDGNRTDGGDYGLIVAHQKGNRGRFRLCGAFT